MKLKQDTRGKEATGDFRAVLLLDVNQQQQISHLKKSSSVNQHAVVNQPDSMPRCGLRPQKNCNYRLYTENIVTDTLSEVSSMELRD